MFIFVSCSILVVTCISCFLVKIRLGSPILFTQDRPGKKERFLSYTNLGL